MCAFRFGWTLDQVDALDPLYALELREAMNARAEHEATRQAPGAMPRKTTNGVVWDEEADTLDPE